MEAALANTTSPERPGFIVAVLGAESTGKTTLVRALHERFADAGRRVAMVEETLRVFCERQGRTPFRHEQAGIAAEQSRRIAEAAARHDLVFADTTALMTAVYSELVFGDVSLRASAERAHSACDLTLLTALDIAWVADGLQRDGPAVRRPVDCLIRAALARTATGFSVIAGSGSARLEAAVASVDRALAASSTVLASALAEMPATAQRWYCERCSDPACERRG